MDTTLRSGPGISPSIRWSVYAGVCLFAFATVTAFILSDALILLADVIGVPVQYSTIVLASPALVIGAGVWWAVVERRNSYAYRLGGVTGFVTALLTGLLWTAQFVRIWGFEMFAVPAVWVLVSVVFSIAAVMGVLAGLSLMYARRQVHTALSGTTERPG